MAEITEICKDIHFNYLSKEFFFFLNFHFLKRNADNESPPKLISDTNSVSKAPVINILTNTTLGGI